MAAGPCGAVTGLLSKSADSRRDGLRRGRRGEEAHVDGRLLCAGPRGHGAVPLLDEAQRGQCPAQGHAAGDVVGRGAELLGLWPTSSAQSALCPVTAEPEWPRCPPGGGRSAVPPLQGPLRDPRSESPGWECPLPPGVRFPAVFLLQPGEQPPDSGTMQGALRPPRGARLGPGDMRRLPVIPSPGSGSRRGGPREQHPPPPSPAALSHWFPSCSEVLF